MTDARVRKAWLDLDISAYMASRIGRAFLDAFKDVRGAPARELLDRLDRELRRAGDGPYLPVVVFRGMDVYVHGVRQEIAPLSSFGVRIRPEEILRGAAMAVGASLAARFLTQRLDGLLIRTDEAEEP